MQLPITKPVLDDLEYANVVKPLQTGWVVQGPFTAEFEERIADYMGAKHAIAVNSCTSGQFIMSRIIGLQEGDEVIVPSFTWISTANSIEFLNATAIFCDIDFETFNIDVSQIEEKITSKTKAIYPVALFGLPAYMKEIQRIADQYNLKIVEDCACGLGGWIDDIHCGLFGEGGILSFHPRKSITTGEGGMIFTNSDDVATKARSLRDHGAIKTDFERHHGKGSFLLTEYTDLGYNMRLTDIQSAIGVEQAKKLPWIFEQKQRLATLFNDRLSSIPWLKAPFVPQNMTHGYQAYVTIFKYDEAMNAIKMNDINAILKLNDQRNSIMQNLEDVGIATRQGTHSVHIQTLYKKKYNFHEMDFPASFAADKLTVALPFYPTMTEDEINYLFDHLNKVAI